MIRRFSHRALSAALLSLALAVAWPVGGALAQSTTEFGGGSGVGGGLVQPFANPGGGAPSQPMPDGNGPSSFNPAPPPTPAPILTPILTPLALETPANPIVVELFTSEGCGTCLAANDFLHELAERRELLPLSFHVDYWDYLGWQDRFAVPAFADRQRAYAAARGKSMMYTPQMVVAGAIESLGTDRKAVEKALKAAERRHEMFAIGLAKDEAGAIHLRLPAAQLSVPASLWFVTYTYEEASDIKAGENRGKRMVTTNVVRSLRKLGMWSGAAEDRIIALNSDEIARKPDACAIIANEAEFGPVVAAAAWDFKDLW